MTQQPTKYPPFCSAALFVISPDGYVQIRPIWRLGTKAPTQAMVKKKFQQQIDVLRKLGTKAPAAAGTETHMGGRLSRYFRYFRADLASPVARMVIGVPWRLRYSRQLTVLAIAAEAPNAVYNVLGAARAVQRRRPRIAAG